MVEIDEQQAAKLLENDNGCGGQVGYVLNIG